MALHVPLYAAITTIVLCIGLISKWLRRKSLKQLRGPPSPSFLLGTFLVY